MYMRRWARVAIPGVLCLLLLLSGCALFNRAPFARISVDLSSGTSPLTVTFDGGDSVDADGVITGFLWDFGDGETATDERVTHTFLATTEAKTFTVTLDVTDDDGATSRASQTIEVLPAATPDGGTEAPIARITTDRLVGLTPLTVAFDGTDSTAGAGSIIEYDWDFGDDERAIGSTVTHTYEPEATTEFTVTLSVWTDAGVFSTAQIEIVVIVPEGVTGDEAPVAEFDASDPNRIYQSEGKPDTPSLFEVTFDPRASYADAGHTIDYYVWDFGDGTAIVEDTDAEVTHVYELRSGTADSGFHTYIARLTVYDDQGLEGSATANITVTDDIE
jgi:PKD repeat protein